MNIHYKHLPITANIFGRQLKKSSRENTPFSSEMSEDQLKDLASKIEYSDQSNKLFIAKITGLSFAFVMVLAYVVNQCFFLLK